MRLKSDQLEILYSVYFSVHVFYTCKLVKCHHARFIRVCTVCQGKKDLKTKIQYLVADEKDGFQLLLTSPLLNKVNVGVVSKIVLAVTD